MTWPGFYALSSAWLFLLFIPLVVFYFLKLKRPRLEVPSLALWRQVINDQRVNSPFQKFKRNLLLLLQLLVLMCLVLAAMQPYLYSGAERARYLPVLIDCSASMAALDGPGGKPRIELAKERAAELIENMLPDQQLALIAVSSTPRRLTEFTNNKRLLREALEKVEVVEVPSNLTDALRMAQALSRTVPIHTVILLTDGNVPAQVDFELPFELNYQKLKPGGTNIGIAALNARRSSETEWDVFVRVEGSKAGQTGGDVELLQDGKSAAQDTVVIDPGKSERLIFRVTAESAAALEVRLKPDGFDSLSSDNIAFLDLPPGRPLIVFCPPELSSYRHALNAHENVLLYPDDEGKGTAASYDLQITDRLSDAGQEATVSLFVGVVPEELQKLVSVETGLAEVVDWQRSSQLLQHAQLNAVQIADQPKVAEGVEDAQFEELGYSILAHGRTGPLILQKRLGRKLAFYLLFHTDRSTLPYRVSFPILVANAVQIGLHEADLSEVRAHATGVLPELNLKPSSSYIVREPEGASRTVKSSTTGLVSGIAAPKVGRYALSEDGKPVASLGAGLLASAETSLESVDEIQFRELSVTVADERIRSDQPLWPYFALAGFALLLVEWWYFQKRPAGIPV